MYACISLLSHVGFHHDMGLAKNLFRYFVKCYRKTQTNFLVNEVESRVNSSLGYPRMSVCECLSLGLSIIVEESFNIMSGKLDGTCPWKCSGSKAGKGNERFSCLKCRFSLNSHFQCLGVFTSATLFIQFHWESTSGSFSGLCHVAVILEGDLRGFNSLLYRFKQALYFQSSTSLSPLVLPLGKFPWSLQACELALTLLCLSSPSILNSQKWDLPKLLNPIYGFLLWSLVPCALTYFYSFLLPLLHLCTKEKFFWSKW